MIKYIIFIALFLSSCSVNFKDYYETDAIEVKNQENISSFS
ncbi:MAG: hypothetical protein P1U46_03740 [Patescibacteria group bacterium]|nr:hypothetical protein [Patescibacteria group bacterium]